MNRAAQPRSIAGRLIAKDLYLYRWMMLAAFLAGAVSLVISEFVPGDGVTTGMNIGVLLFITTIITYGIFIPMIGVLKERQSSAHLFVMSFPVSIAQYSLAKVTAAVIAFVTPWFLLTGGVLAITALTGSRGGPMPFFVLMMLLFVLNFSVLMTINVIARSEVWPIAGILILNVMIPIFLATVGSLPGIAEHRLGPVAVWSPAVLTILTIEIVLIVISLSLAYYLPSRKKDFI